MKFADRLLQASFVRRENRFSCVVRLAGREEVVYLANSGRLETVLSSGRAVFLAERSSPQRTTRYDLVLAVIDGSYVSVDDRIPADLINQALLTGTLPGFPQYSSIRREIARGRMRLDFLLSGPNSQCFLEVKSVTLVKKGMALFPDAPTLRGKRHVESLVWAKKEGYEAAIIFVVQREDASRLSPNDQVDRNFGRALRLARLSGVGVRAYRCHVTTREISLAEEIPVSLSER
jgi:sugar fermentation stimulation protein A